jgi:hypothetical protein
MGKHQLGDLVLKVLRTLAFAYLFRCNGLLQLGISRLILFAILVSAIPVSAKVLNQFNIDLTGRSGRMVDVTPAAKAIDEGA